MAKISSLVAGRRNVNTGATNQVFDTSGVLNTYAQVLAREQSQRAKEQADLQQYLTTAKTDGLREADRDDYFKKYEDWRNKAIEAYKAPSGVKRAILKAEADKVKSDMDRFVNESKTAAKQYYDFQGQLLNDRFRNQFADDAIARVQKASKVAMSDPSFVKDFTTLERQVDISKELEKLNKLDSEALKNAKYANPATRRIVSGNKKGTEYAYSKSVDPSVQVMNYATLYDTDRNFKAFIQKQYAPLFDQMDDNAAKSAAIQDLVKKRPVVQQDKPTISWDTPPDNFYAHQAYRNQNTPTVVNEQLEARKQWIQDIKDGVPGSGEKLSAFISGNTDFSNNPEDGGKFAIGPLKKGKRDIYVPAKIKPDGTVITSGKRYTVDFNDPNYELQMNQIINAVTGQNMDIGYSVGLKGNTKGTTRKSTSTSAPNSTMVTVTVNGRTGQIPQAQVEAFRKKYPNAQVR